MVTIYKNWMPEDWYYTGPKVTTRERGVIPGCVPAVDVFVETDTDTAAWNTWNAADNYIYLRQTLTETEWASHPIHSWKWPEPFFNRSRPVQKSRYLT